VNIVKKILIREDMDWGEAWLCCWIVISFSISSLHGYECQIENWGDCVCVFPFKYNGVSYDSCTNVDAERLWCATGVDGNGVLTGSDYGWCREETRPAANESLQCVTEINEACVCVFPFKYNGVSYNSCTNVGEEALWCATAVDQNQKYSGEYGWCLEAIVETGLGVENDKEEGGEKPSGTSETKSDVCFGKCSLQNQKCEKINGRPQCRCLDGYLDGEEGDGSDCQCVYDWYNERRRGNICKECTLGFELKKWENGMKQWCEKETRECDPDIKTETDPNYPNIERVGQGYNMLIGNLLELPDIDEKGHKGFRGLQKPIFSPYSAKRDETPSRCKINGYILDPALNCEASLQTTAFTNSQQVVAKIQENVRTGVNSEEFAFTVSEGENAQFSNSISFGESFSQTSDSTEGTSGHHCVDESLSESTEEGATVEISRTSEEGSSFEESQSEGQNEESTNTKTRESTRSQFLVSPPFYIQLPDGCRLWVHYL